MGGRLVIAGDSLSDLTREKGEQNKALYLTAGNAAGSIAAVRQLDDLLVQAALTMSVDLMPGPQDPATCVLPQQPLHRLMFPQTGRMPTFQSVTNLMLLPWLAARSSSPQGRQWQTFSGTANWLAHWRPLKG